MNVLPQHEQAEPLANSVNEEPLAAVSRRRLWGFVGFTVVLTICFIKPLLDLAQFCLKSDLYSYILLIPFVSAYLIWQKRKELPAVFERSGTLACLTALVGAGVLFCPWAATDSGYVLAEVDHLALAAFSFLILLTAGGFFFLGATTLRVIAFPAGFLIFSIPLPGFIRSAADLFLQHGSAETGFTLVKLSGTPMFRQGLVLQIPGIAIEVAEECSGIHSSLVLFITSVLAGRLFLRSPWKRAVLTLAIIPLAILRNGLRIAIIALLCVQIGPHMINSIIHRKGGPFFFALSLIPFFLLLLWLRKLERDRVRRGTNQNLEKGATNE